MLRERSLFLPKKKKKSLHYIVICEFSLSLLFCQVSFQCRHFSSCSAALPRFPTLAPLADSQSFSVERQLQLLLLRLCSMALPSTGRGRSPRHPHSPPCLRIRFQTKKLCPWAQIWKSACSGIFHSTGASALGHVVFVGAKELSNGWGCVGLELRAGACKFMLVGNCPYLYVCLVWIDLLHLNTNP